MIDSILQKEKILLSFSGLLSETNQHVWGMCQALYLELFMICTIIPVLLKTHRTNVTWEIQDLNISLLGCTAPTVQMLEVASQGPPDFSRAPTDTPMHHCLTSVYRWYSSTLASPKLKKVLRHAQLLFQSVGSLHFWGQLFINRAQQLVYKHTCVPTLQ